MLLFQLFYQLNEQGFLHLKPDEDENLRGQEVRLERSERTPEGYWQSLSTRSKSSAPARRKSAASG
ncbi:hypothetical protein GQ050_000660 [Salmonella enterica]|nr:hypothetical protein [Salmonella enterica]